MRTRPLSLESLEARYTPAVAYTFLGAGPVTLLSGTTAGAGITVGVTGGGNVEVDGADTGVAASAVESFTLIGDGAAANPITLDHVNASTYPSLIAATIDGNGSGSTLALDESTSAATTFTIWNTHLSGPANLVYANLAGLSILAGPNSDTFNVVQTYPGGAMPLTLDGGDDTDTLYAPGATNAWLIGSPNGGTITGSGSTITFTTSENLTGGSGNDTFTVSVTGDVSGAISGGAGTDTLDLGSFSTDTTVSFTATNAGTAANTTVGTLTFNQTESFVSGPGNDKYVFSAGVGISGSINSTAGKDWLNYSAYTTAVSVLLDRGSATGVNGGVTGIENAMGGSGADVFIAVAGGSVFVGNAGADRLTGGAGKDFLIGGDGIDRIDGGAGDDIMVGSMTDWDANYAALESIWSDLSAAASIAAARAAVNAGAFPLNAATTDNDGDNDQLVGRTGDDWFLVFAGDVTVDFGGSDIKDTL